MRLDETTLTGAEVATLLDALLDVPVVARDGSRDGLVAQVDAAPEVGYRISRGETAREDAWNLWRVCSERGYLDGRWTPSRRCPVRRGPTPRWRT